MTTYTLRPYQQECVDACMDWMSKNSVAAAVEATGGMGKSIVIAEVARLLHERTGKHVLIVVPNVDLLYQNCEKLEAIGCKFSIYSASASQKSVRHPIVVTTEGTWKSVAKEKAHLFCAVLVDEGDRTTATLCYIRDEMLSVNPLIRFMAFTGTPFRLMSGYIYELDIDGTIVDEAINPFYKKLIYRLTCNELITMGYLTPVQVGLHSEGYDTSNLKLSGDEFTSASLRDVFEEKGVITKGIVEDIVAKTKDRKGVMIFASTLKHAEEICSHLPDGSYVYLHGKLSKKDRKDVIARFKNQEVKYLVNKDIATVGFDAPHVDCVALMRATSSNRLFQQIVWRGVRLYEGKTECLLLDYARNIENLFDGSDDIFSPVIKAYGKKPTEQIEVCCPLCGTSQNAGKRPKFDQWDVNGYATDLAGDQILIDNQPVPAHYLRRCKGVVAKGKNVFEQCEYKWSFKTCSACGAENDIAARNCSSCGLTLISPDDKLNPVAHVIPVGEKMTVRVNNMELKRSTDGQVVYVNFDTQHGEIKCRFFPMHSKIHVSRHWWAFKRSTEDATIMPKYIEYTRQESGYCSINRYMREGLAG